LKLGRHHYDSHRLNQTDVFKPREAFADTEAYKQAVTGNAAKSVPPRGSRLDKLLAKGPSSWTAKEGKEFNKLYDTQNGAEATAPVGAPAPAASAAGKTRELLSEISHGTVTTPRIDDFLAGIKKDLKDHELAQLLVELKIAGKPKSKSHAVEKIGQVLKSQLEMHVKAQAFEESRPAAQLSRGAWMGCKTKVTCRRR